MKKAVEIQRLYYTQTAGFYENRHVHPDDEHQVALKYMSALVKALGCRSILDVGSGTGRVLKYFSEREPNLTARGVEPVKALIDQAIKKNGISPNLLLCGSGDFLPFKANSYDAVCAFGILHHVEAPNVVVTEILRVAKKAVFISDSNRFGQGSTLARLIKLSLYKTGLWGTANLIKTRGKGYLLSEGDGLSYSYSVFDNYHILADWADRLVLVPTGKQKAASWYHPLLTSGTVLLCALRE